MLRRLFPICLLAVLLTSFAWASGAADFAGEWRTSFGVVTLKQSGDEVSGTYGDASQFILKGKADGNNLSFAYEEGQASGDATWTLDKTGLAFNGRFQVRGGRAGTWDGWRPDPKATDGANVNVAGLWLTEQGLMELGQAGDKVKGRFAARGGSDIEGTVKGRRVEFTYNAFRTGKGWFDVSADAKDASLNGAAVTDGTAAWFGWRGRRAPEFARHAKLVAAKIVDGSTTNLLTYSVRAPQAYRESDGKKWPTIVILHGSNMSGKAYVNTIAAAWPDVAKDYVLLGINGETPASIGTEPAFNFSYVSYVGKSTFKGFPGTDRESPALVAEAMAELRDAYPIEKYFVGGHSQGGFLTYSLLMNIPEQMAGAFPISSGAIFQTEPSAYDDEKVRAAQRSVPLAIVHSQQDNVVPFSMGENAATTFGEAGWHAFRFFIDEKGAGHRFALLPVGDAIRWLEAQSSDNPTKLMAFAEQSLKAKRYRDAVAATNRAATLKPTGTTKERLDRLTKQLDARAAPGAKKFLPLIKEPTDGKWIDDFLAYRDDFEFAPAAAEVMKAFDSLRTQHDAAAKKLIDEANVAFRQGDRDGGYAKYNQIVERHYAAAAYRNVKRWVAERK